MTCPHTIAADAHADAIDAHEEAIRRRSQIAAMDAIAQTETANEQSALAGMPGHEGRAPTAAAEAESALQSWENGNSGVAAHRVAIAMHREIEHNHRIAAIAAGLR